ncbi:MAG: hypothetical protein JW940_30750 [Polyangiaceae bacterium]|nr:hypothetical protein [Polyangiaceae bacterium]
MVGQARLGTALGLLLFCFPAVAQSDPSADDPPSDDSPARNPFAAEAPATAGVLQLEAGFRYGFDLGDTGVSPWGAGVGLGVGYTLDSSIYLAALAEYFFGRSGMVGVNDVDKNLIQLVGEVGYDVALLKRWVARGKGFVAGARIAKESCSSTLIPGGGSPCPASASINLGFGPGVSLMYVGPQAFFSLDGRYEIVLSDPRESSIIVAVGIGF